MRRSCSSISSLAQKLELVPGSLEHGLAIESQAKEEKDHNAAATLFLHAAGVLSAHNAADARRARHDGAVRLLMGGRTDEALAELKFNERFAASPVDAALSRVSIGLVEVIRGNKEDGINMLQDSMLQLHQMLGRAHPVARTVQKLWVIADMQDDNPSLLIKHV